MARNTVYLDVVVDDKGTTRRIAVDTNRLADAMGRTARNTAEADRNMKGAAQASSNATKNFSKMSQGMGGLVAAYATIAAQVFALSAAYQFLLQAADFRILIEGQKALTEQTGVGYASITKSIQAATDAQLGYKQAAQAAAIGTAAGLSATMLKDIASYSQTISAVLGRDLEDTFNRLIRGITKAEPELLDELGIVLRLADATTEYARSINKTASDLTAYERTQGVALFTLEQAERKYGALRDSSELSANGIRQLGAAFSELGNKILPEVAKVAEFLAGSVKNNVAAVASAFGLLLGGVLKQALPDMETITKRIDAKIEGYANKIADYTLEADAFARGQLTITKSVKPAVDNIQNLSSAVKRLQGAKAPPIIDDLLRLTAGDKFDPGQVTAMIKQIDDDLKAMASHQARNPALRGLSKEQLEETKAGLEEMQSAAQKATKGMEGQFQRLGNTIGQAAAESKLAWASAMQGLQQLTLKAVIVMNRIINAIGIIGLVITIAEVIKTTALYLIDRFGKKDLVQTSLAEQIIGDSKEIELLKEQIKDVERAARGLDNIKTIGTFLDVASFEASMGGNIPDSMDKFIQQAKSADSVFEQLQDNIKEAEKRLKGLERPSRFLTPITEGGIPPSAVDSYHALQDEIGRTSRQLEKAQLVQDAARDNQLTLIEAYAQGIPELRKYVQQIQVLKQATEVSSKEIVDATKDIVEYAKAAKSVAISLQAYSEGFKTLEKQLIDSISLSPLQKRLVQVSDLVKNLSDAFKEWNGSTSTDLFKTQATFKAFTGVLVKLRDQFRRTFDLQEQEKNIARVRNSIALFSAENFQPLSLLEELDEAELNLQLNKLKTELETIKLDKDLFDLIKGKNPVINAAIASDSAATALRAAGVENADTLKTEFSSATNTFIEQLREENDYLIKNLAAINDKESKVTERPLTQNFNDLVSQEVTFDPKSVEELRKQALSIAPERNKPFINEEINRFKEIALNDFYTSDQISELSSKLQKNISDYALEDVSNQAKNLTMTLEEAVRARMDENQALKEQEITQLAILGKLKIRNDNENRILQNTLARNKAESDVLTVQDKIDSFRQNTEQRLDAQVKLSEQLGNLESQAYNAIVDTNRKQEDRLTVLKNSKDITEEERKVYIDELAALQAANQEREHTVDLARQLNAEQRKEENRQTSLALIKEQTDAATNLLNIQQELNSLRNPYLQEEANERLGILRTQVNILSLQKQISDATPANIANLEQQLALEEAKLFVMQEQSAEINKISQAAQGAFGEGLQQEIANFLKGGQVDIENSFLNIIKSVGEAAADQLSQSITESIMGGIFGEQTPEAKMKNGVVEGATIGAEILAQGVASGVSGITIPTGPAAAATAPGGVPTADPAVTASRSIGKDLRNFGNKVQDTFASDAPFLDKLGSIFNADAPWINSMTRGLAGALGGLAVGALSGGGSGNAWRSAIIGGVVSGLSYGFTSWLGGLKIGTGAAASGAGAAQTGAVFGNSYNPTSSLQSTIDSSVMTKAVPIIKGATGGIMPGGFRAFAEGGIVNKPTLGLVGEGRYNEAVVPLPDGKSIPVIMQTGGGDRNNIGININVNSGGQMQSDAQATGERGVAMAQAIQNVVQLELKRQKRPGGLLSPF